MRKIKVYIIAVLNFCRYGEEVTQSCSFSVLCLYFAIEVNKK